MRGEATRGGSGGSRGGETRRGVGQGDGEARELGERRAAPMSTHPDPADAALPRCPGAWAAVARTSGLSCVRRGRGRGGAGARASSGGGRGAAHERLRRWRRRARRGPRAWAAAAVMSGLSCVYGGRRRRWRARRACPRRGRRRGRAQRGRRWRWPARRGPSARAAVAVMSGLPGARRLGRAGSTWEGSSWRAQARSKIQNVVGRRRARLGAGDAGEARGGPRSVARGARRRAVAGGGRRLSAHAPMCACGILLRNSHQDAKIRT